MDRAFLGKRYGKLRLFGLRYPAILEMVYKKGHKYRTMVYHMEGRKVVNLGVGRTTGSLFPSLIRLKQSGAWIKAIATDMRLRYWVRCRNIFPKQRWSSTCSISSSNCPEPWMASAVPAIARRRMGPGGSRS